MVEDVVEQAGDFKIELAQIIAVDGSEVDVTADVMEIFFYEDTQNPALSGTIAFKDNFNLQNVMPILGQELLRLHVRTPSLIKSEEAIDFRNEIFFIHNIEAIVPMGDMNQTNILNFISKEAILNQRKTISKTLKGTYSSIVSSILRNELECTKDIYIEPSSGVKQMMAPDTHPFDIIDIAKREAVSSEHGSPTYLFYETMNGYHFRSLESLYVSEPIAHYSSSSQGGLNVARGGRQEVLSEYSKIIEYSTDVKPDTLLNSASGVFGSKLITHDIFNKTYTTSTYNYFDSFDNEKHINELSMKDGEVHPMFSDLAVDSEGNRISDFPSKTYLLPVSIKDTSKGNDAHFRTALGNYPFSAYNPDRWLQRRSSQMSQLDNGISISITVAGNTILEAGTIVDLELPYSAMDKSEKRETTDRFYRGPFLVRALQHRFDNGSMKHTVIMNLVKDCVDKKLEGSKEGIVPITTIGESFTDNEYFYTTNT